MTKVYISNKDNTFQASSYYIEIYAEKVDEDYTAEMAATVPYARAKSKWNLGASTFFVDILKRKRAITITGYIDKYSNRDSSFAASVVYDAKVVERRLDYFWRYGGTVKLIIGKDDGYYNVGNSGVITGTFNSTTINAEVIEGVITRMTFSEFGEDHYTKTVDSEDYPSSEFKLAGKIKVMLTIEEGTVR